MDDQPITATPPTVAEIERIVALSDLVVRNLQITLCYHELSNALQERTGACSNWCTYATWASKQAGQSIRKEDLARVLEDVLLTSPEVMAAIHNLAEVSKRLGTSRSLDEIRSIILQALNLAPAVERTSQAVAGGNLKVFAEIGHEFARFFAVCLRDTAPDAEKITYFCEALQTGDPPDGQDYLRRSFSHLYQAFFEQEPHRRAELILLANLEIGFHEQTRLQPEIQAAMDAPVLDAAQFLRRLLTRLFPLTSSAILYSRMVLMRLLGRPPILELAILRLLHEVQARVEEAVTGAMMSIALPQGGRLRLGYDLVGDYPAVLRQITHPELCALLAQIDPTPDSPFESGAVNWADLPDRLHFIVDLFRLYHEQARLFESPFAPSQIEFIREGRLPPGRL